MSPTDMDVSISNEADGQTLIFAPKPTLVQIGIYETSACA